MLTHRNSPASKLSPSIWPRQAFINDASGPCQDNFAEVAFDQLVKVMDRPWVATLQWTFTYHMEKRTRIFIFTTTFGWAKIIKLPQYIEILRDFPCSGTLFGVVMGVSEFMGWYFWLFHNSNNWGFSYGTGTWTHTDGERQELFVCRTVTEMSTICNHKKPGFSVFFWVTRTVL